MSYKTVNQVIMESYLKMHKAANACESRGRITEKNNLDFELYAEPILVVMEYGDEDNRLKVKRARFEYINDALEYVRKFMLSTKRRIDVLEFRTDDEFEDLFGLFEDVDIDSFDVIKTQLKKDGYLKEDVNKDSTLDDTSRYEEVVKSVAEGIVGLIHDKLNFDGIDKIPENASEIEIAKDMILSSDDDLHEVCDWIETIILNLKKDRDISVAYDDRDISEAYDDMVDKIAKHINNAFRYNPSIDLIEWSNEIVCRFIKPIDIHITIPYNLYHDDYGKKLSYTLHINQGLKFKAPLFHE